MKEITELKRIMRVGKLSIENVARELGISSRTVFRWLHGKSKPSDLALTRLREFKSRHVVVEIEEKPAKKVILEVPIREVESAESIAIEPPITPHKRKKVEKVLDFEEFLSKADLNLRKARQNFETLMEYKDVLDSDVYRSRTQIKILRWNAYSLVKTAAKFLHGENRAKRHGERPNVKELKKIVGVGKRKGREPLNKSRQKIKERS